ncbi:MAG: DNA-3-methyladenine glycosylase [Halodesulfurarchaeum sp.]
MRSGTIDDGSFRGPMNLQATLESGQTFLWERTDEASYGAPVRTDVTPWYRTVHDGNVLEVRQTTDGLEWRGSEGVGQVLRSRLRLSDDLDRILDRTPDDRVIQRAIGRYRGMRLVNEPFFPTVISFILSAQMRIPRIHRLVSTLRRTYGQAHSRNGDVYYEFPSPESLAAASEADLREKGLGYRAPYVTKSAALIADGEIDPDEVRTLPYEEARDALMELVGVGHKVADCVLLFSLGFDEAVPLDTWIRSAIADHFPEAAGESYRETSRAIRERFGPEPGYTQTYVFHYLRSGGEDDTGAD